MTLNKVFPPPPLERQDFPIFEIKKPNLRHFPLKSDRYKCSSFCVPLDGEWKDILNFELRQNSGYREQSFAKLPLKAGDFVFVCTVFIFYFFPRVHSHIIHFWHISKRKLEGKTIFCSITIYICSYIVSRTPEILVFVLLFFHVLIASWQTNQCSLLSVADHLLSALCKMQFQLNQL